MQEVKEVSCQKQEIKGIVKLQQQTGADGTTEDAVWDNVCKADYFKSFSSSFFILKWDTNQNPKQMQSCERFKPSKAF